MIVLIPGTLCASKMNSPKPGQEFQTHQLLSIMQINDGAAEVTKVKDMDLERVHKEGEQVKLKCDLNYWQNGNRSGITIKLIDSMGK